MAPIYFETLGTRFLAGRDFNFQDQGCRVAIVNRSMARYYFPGGNPIGKHFTLDGGDRPSEIVGMAGDARYYEMREASRMPLDPEIAAYLETQNHQPRRSGAASGWWAEHQLLARTRCSLRSIIGKEAYADQRPCQTGDDLPQ